MQQNLKSWRHPTTKHNATLLYVLWKKIQIFFAHNSSTWLASLLSMCASSVFEWILSLMDWRTEYGGTSTIHHHKNCLIKALTRRDVLLKINGSITSSRGMKIFNVIKNWVIFGSGRCKVYIPKGNLGHKIRDIAQILYW